MNATLLRRVLLPLLSFSGLPLAAQMWASTDTSALMEAVTRNQTLYGHAGSYVLSGTLSAFRDMGDETASERESITVWRTPEGYKATHFGLTTLQDERVRVLINPDQHRIYLSQPTGMLDMVDAGLRSEVFAIATALERGDRLDGVHFRLSFPQGANFASLELVFDGKGWLRRMVTCWGHPVPIDPENPLSATVTPKTVLELGVPQPLRHPVDTSPGQAVAFTKDGPVAKGPWHGYEVFDTRIQ